MSSSTTEPVAATTAEPTTAPKAWQTWVVALPVSLVLALAAVLASVPVRDSAVWRHLATGRALVDGRYALGTDPFAYTTAGLAWVNHAWAYDLALYGLYQVLDTQLGVLQVVLAVALAAVVLLAARPRVNPWTAAFSVALALVALGPYLGLAPALVSYVLFAILLCCLNRGTSASASPRRFLASVALVSLVWVNCDDWFVLAPLTVALYALGLSLTKDLSHRRCWAAALLSVACCLVNPHHVRAFVVPAGLQDAVTGEPAVSTIEVLRSLSPGTTPIPLAAVLLLLALCLLALAAGRRPRDWPLALVLAAIIAVSLFHGAAIPFLAIVAGPFLARAWPGAMTRSAAPRRLALLGPLALTAGLVGLLVAAGPGWLQGTAERRGWFLHDDPSLRQLARQVAEWRAAGQLPEPLRCFNTSVEVAHYLEWYCPGVPVFIDSRPHLYPAEVTADFRAARQALAQEPALAAQQSALDRARLIFERWQVSYLVVSDPAERLVVATLWNLWQAPSQWALVALAGRATVFAQVDTAPGSMALDVAIIDLGRRAFDPEPADEAPRQAPGEPPTPRPWWDCIARPEAAAAQKDRDEALIYLAHFEALQPAYARRNFVGWQVKLALATLAPLLSADGAERSAIGAALPAALLAASQRTQRDAGYSLQRLVQYSFAADQAVVNDGPPGSLLLAIRSARRALHADPADALAYLRLGHAYERLESRTVERTAVAEFPFLNQLRRVQAISALKAALRLRPDLFPAHQLLASLYERAGALDLASEHLQAQVRLARAAGPRPGETPADYLVRVDDLAARAQNLGRVVRDRLNLTATKSFDQNAYAKARMAESAGIPGHALELLQRSSYGEFGVQGAIIEVHLLFFAGHVHEARTWLDPTQETVMGTFNYQWLQALAAAATGDYASADAALQHLQPALVDLPDFRMRQVSPRLALGLVVGEQLLQATAFGPWAHREKPEAVQRRLVELASLPRHQADAQVLRGVLALEAGALPTARQALNSALTTWNGDTGSAAIARHYLGLMRRR